MEEPNSTGRQTPGSKPTTPVPQQPPSSSAPVSSQPATSAPSTTSTTSTNPAPQPPQQQPPPVSGPAVSSSAPSPAMSSQSAPNSATSHGPRYSYPPPPSHMQQQQHGPYDQSNHAMANHQYGPYGPPPPPPSQQGHGGQYMPMMMPPPSQYPNKPPMSHGMPPQGPPPPSGTQPPPPHPHAVPQMMPSDRMAYYGRMPGPPPPPPHHQQHPQQPPYYMRHGPPQPQQANKPMYYQPNSGYYPGQPPPDRMPMGHPMSMPPMPMAGPMGPMTHHQGLPPPHMVQQQQPPPHVYGNHHANSGVPAATTAPTVDTNNGPPANQSTPPVTSSNSSAPPPPPVHANGNLRHPQPPSIMDEVSQTSTASSQAADDSCASTDMPPGGGGSASTGGGHKPPKHHLSHPSTPNTSNLGSPGAASLSSYHDDFDSVSSPSWPRTPASPALNSSQFDTHAHNTKRPDSVQKLYEMSDEPDRKGFLDKFLQFQEERGTPLNQVPTISKIPLDLYRLYISVKERGGFVEVTRSKLWKECAQYCSIANSSSAAYTLRKQYMKHLLPFECKFDRGGIDPGPVLSSLETTTSSSRKKAAASNAKMANSGQSTPTTPRLSPNDNSSSPYGPPGSGPAPHPGYEMDPQQHNYPPPNSTHSGPPYPPPPPPQQHPAQYHHGEYPYPGQPTGQMPPPPAPTQHPNQQANSQPPGPSPAPTTNHESVSVKDPFADDDQSATSSAAAPSNYPPSRPHYTMPPNSNSYYNQVPPTSHPPSGNSYPDPAHPPPPPPHQQHYPDPATQVGYSRSSGAPASSDAQGMQTQHPQYGPYSSRNGPHHGGYYGAYPPPPPPTSQGQPYEHGPPPRGPYDHRSMGHGPDHYGSGHPQSHNSSPHRYPMPNNAPVAPGTPGAPPPPPPPHHSATPPVSSAYGPGGPIRPPYGAQPPPPHHMPPAGAPAPQGPPQQPPPHPHHPNTQQPPPPPSQDSRNSEAYNSALRMQSPLAQRLLAAKEPSTTQAYTGSGYTTTTGNSSGAPIAQTKSGSSSPAVSAHHQPPPPPPQANSNISWMSSSSPRYSQPKRHPDFAKQPPSSDSPYPPHSGYPPQYNHYNSRSPSTGWNQDRYRMSTPYGHSGYPNRDGQWSDSRSSTPSGEATPPSSHWPPNRYPGYPDYSHYSHSGGGHGMNKMGPNQIQGYNSRHPEMMAGGPRPNYMSPMMHSSHNSHAGSKLPPMGHAGPHSVPYGQPYPHGHYQHGPASHHPQMRRDSIFPPNTVEATMPTMSKKRKLTARDISPVEAWRLYMALKSGLLAESSFALDVLNIYSNDDSTLIFFGLNNMPGMLEVLLEHYKCYLNEMFDNLFNDTEIGFEAKQLRSELEQKYSKYRNVKSKLDLIRKQRPWYELSKDDEEEDAVKETENVTENGSEKPAENGDAVDDEDEDDDDSGKQVVLFNSTNYTHVTRTGKPVKFKKTKNLFSTDYEKSWDEIKNGFVCGSEHWASGGGETTSHIQTHLEPKENYLRFVRMIKKSTETNGIIENGNDNGSVGSEKKGENEEEKKREKCDEFVRNEEKYPKIRLADRERYWKRLNQPEYEEESYDQEEPTVCTGRDYQDSIKSRCLTVSNLIRNLTFVPGNDLEMCKHPGLLLVMSRLILLHHVHAIKRKRKISEIDCSTLSANKLDDETLFNLTNDEKEKNGGEEETLTEREWWWDSLHILRENTLVTIANLSGHLDLSSFPEQITLTLLDGLLHWAVCPSSYAQDSLPSAHSSLSPKRLAYETLSKLSIIESNVDLILATPPWARLEKLFGNLSRSLGRHEEQTIREFSIVLLSNFSSAEASSARAIALTGCAIPLLIGFIEQAEQSALHVANTQGIHALRENPELMGTTLDMIRRSAGTLRNLARVTENRSLFIQHEQRLLSLGMSQILDQSVAVIIADVLFEASTVVRGAHLSRTESLAVAGASKPEKITTEPATATVE